VASLGLLGGTFNPPHIGHLVCAMEARDQLGLDLVALLPANVPPHKAVADDPGATVRAELCELAAATEPGLVVRHDEIRRPGPSYTVDTLRALHETGDELTFIVGGDQALGLPEWREPETIVSLARFAVADRGDASRERVGERLSGWDVTFFDMPRLDVSSSLIRARVAAGRPIRHLVPSAVAERIGELGLYRAGVTA
jgi:nicotinate-nucleotide adenylyltransferase